MAVLVQKSVKRTLFNMAFPMLAGTFAMNAYNLTDTYFVAQLGTAPLAAMGYTQPVIMLLTFIAGGFGTGIMTLMSHAIGRHDHADAAKLVTHGLLLILLVTTAMSIAGYLTIDEVFTSLGADEETLPLVRQYMGLWYLGALTMSLPMLGNGLLISMGDSKAASFLMILGTVVNTMLDPIMIFGFLGCPAMGMSGAALATVISQAISAITILVLLHRRHRLLALHGWTFLNWLGSCRRILGFAIPSILTMMLMPISAGIITKILSWSGHAAVAAASAAGRLEMFSFVIPMALGMSLTPFVSQNFGAARLDRIRQARHVSTRFALAYGGLAAVVFYVSAPWMASLFSEDPEVISIMVTYIRIVSFGWGMMEVHRYSGFFLTGLHQPIQTTLLNVTRVLVFLVPLSYLGWCVFGLTGVFVARLATDLAVGVIGLLWVGRVLRRVSAAEPAPTAEAEIAAAPADAK